MFTESLTIFRFVDVQFVIEKVGNIVHRKDVIADIDVNKSQKTIRKSIIPTDDYISSIFMTLQ